MTQHETLRCDLPGSGRDALGGYEAERWSPASLLRAVWPSVTHPLLVPRPVPHCDK